MFNITALYHWFHNYYHNFYSSDPDIMNMVQLKESHSVRVANHARELAKSIGLSAEKLDLAEGIGLLHDIARSEQAHLKTFNDAISFDHGDRGVLRLEEAGILGTLDCEAQEIALFSIKYHNKMTVPNTSLDKMLFAGIIRDADKLDIFRNLPPVVADHNYSPTLVDLLREGRTLPYSEVKTAADKRLIRLGWLYDINYKWTFSQLINEGYADQLVGALPDAPPFNEIKDAFRAYIKVKLVANP
jgi:putative nucleotidyltransferase with HDIG domain